MAHPDIAFIGAGNMAQAIIGGLIADGYPRERLIAAEPQPDQRESVEDRHGIRTVADNRAAVDNGQVVILAVKPQILRAVCQAIGPSVQAGHPLVISVAAGVCARDISRWLGNHVALIRVMPNSPALIGAGVAGMFANDLVDTAQRALAERLMRAVGSVVWLEDEALLDPVTAISGSGPAYFFLLMEVMVEVGAEMGLSRDAARKLTTETALGAAKMALLSEQDLAVLRQQVTSPGGTTEAAIRTFEREDLRGIVRAALVAARNRGIEIADTFGSD